MILQDLGPNLLDSILLLVLLKVQLKNKIFIVFLKLSKLYMDALLKTSKKLLLELDSMEDLMDQSQKQIQHSYQVLNVQDLLQVVQLKKEHIPGMIYIRTILEKMELVLMGGQPIIILNLHLIYYIMMKMMKLLVINHQEVQGE